MVKINVESDELAYLNLTNEDLRGIENPFSNVTQSDLDNLHLYVLKIMKNPKYFHWTVKTFLNIDLLPEQVAILREMWNKSFPMYIASRGFGKSFLLAVYCTLRCLLIPGTKVVIVGAAFRQSKVIFDYMDTIWRNAPLLQSVCNDSSGPRRDVDRCMMKINESWTIAVPLGDGSKIRGLRAHVIIADEFNSIPVEIYEKVVSGFASVTADPTSNVKAAATRRKKQKEGRWETAEENKYQKRQKNQSILSGTCGYEFEPFAQYWKNYKKIIASKGNIFKSKKDENGEEQDSEIPEYMSRLDWKQFSIVRIPYELIPEGFMDDQQVTRARATIHNGIYQMEYGACFASDSQGFFRRTLIEAATAHDKNVSKPGWPSYCPTTFDVSTRGIPGKTYVFGIDPASQQDNFAIVVLELHNEHQRLVYSWTTNKKDFQARIKLGLTDIGDYYSFCVRKIRELMRVFPCVRIGIDSQGGGYQIAEGLADEDKMHPGERKILPIIEEEKQKPTDDIAGDHIIEFINFAKSEWTSQANHGLRKDIEDKVLLFPRFDTLTLTLLTEKDRMQFASLQKQFGNSESLKLYDTLEDCVLDVEELKTELTTIVVTVTSNGREHFDTPEIKLDTGKKGRMRKDRYSALVIANMISRGLHRSIPAPTYVNIGRLIGSQQDSLSVEVKDKMYHGPEWASSYTPQVCVIVRKEY